MLHSNAPSQGFTSIEIAVTVLAVGILAAIITPSLLAWQEKRRVTEAIQTIQAALINARHQAIRNGKACQVSLNTSSATVQGVLLSSTSPATALTTPCISTGAVDLNNMSGFQVGAPIRLWATSVPTALPPTITFTYKGNSTNSVQLMVYQDNRPSTALGLEVSTGLGMMRVCRYQNSTLPPTALTSANCSTLQ